MDFILDGLREAWQLILHHDAYLWKLVWVTLKVAAVSTAVALVIGLPIGLTLGLGRFRGRGVLMVLANAGLGLPPVVVGLVLSLLMFPAAPLGRFHLLFTLRGVYVAQSLLALPVIVALSAAAVGDLTPGLLSQARAYGARRWQLALLALHEARIGIMAAVIAAAGSAMSEVGAIVLVGGNILGVDQTLATAALQEVEAGHFANGIAIAILLMGLILVVLGLLTLLQQVGAARRMGASS